MPSRLRCHGIPEHGDGHVGRPAGCDLTPDHDHGALARDLRRVGETVTEPQAADPAQRRALGEHVVWLMGFLHEHHASEDEGLWPAVRAANPDAGPLLDSLEADHRSVEPAAAALRSAGERCAAGDAMPDELVAALDALSAVLLPHLDREVTDAMPVVSASITHGEWHAIEQRFNVKPKTVSELGFVGHWLIDDLDDDGREVVLHTVPAIPRFVLLHGFARSYERRMAAVWGRDRARAE